MRDLEELVGDGELHIPPCVGEELRELCFARRRAHDLDAEGLEESGRALICIGARRADELRQAADLLQRMALGDSLRAEHNVGLEARGVQAPLDSLRRAGEHGRPQHDQAMRPDVGDELVDQGSGPRLDIAVLVGHRIGHRWGSQKFD